MGLMDFISRFRKRGKGLSFLEAKQRAFEKLLGPMYEEVGVPIEPLKHKRGMVSGELTRYYFPNILLPEGGTAFGTMDLMPANGRGPKNPDGYYELVAFTKQPFTGIAIPKKPVEGSLSEEPEMPPDTPYNRAEARIWFIFNQLAYKAMRDNVVLKPGDTMAFSADETGQPDAFIFITRYSSRVKPFFSHNRMKAHLLLVMEISVSEYEKANKVGMVNMTNFLKGNNRWPYSLEPSWGNII